MAAPALYQLVDELATSLDHGVVIGSRDFRLVAHSAHQPGVDAVRRASILSRRPSAGCRSACAARGSTAPQVRCGSPLRRAAHDEQARRRDPAPVAAGLPWVVLGPGEVSGRQLALVGRDAVTAGELMFADEFLEGSRRSQHSGWLQGLLGDETARTARSPSWPRTVSTPRPVPSPSSARRRA